MITLRQNMRKPFFWLLSLLVLTSFSIQVNAQDSPFNFLRYVQSARSAGLSGAVVSLPEDISVIYFNPAALNTIGENNFNATFLKHVLDINSGNVSYSPDLNINGSFAASIGFTNYGSFDYADAQGNVNGTFTSNDISIGITYSNSLDSNLHYGVTAKYIFVGLEEVSTSALALDFGLLYEIPNKRTNIGFSILHLGSQLNKISDEGEELPLDARIGVNHRLKGLPLLINFNFHHLADVSDGFFDRFRSFSVGGEFYFGENVEVRLGYNNEVRNFTNAETESPLTGLSGGIGIKTEVLNFDYGFSKYGSAANMHRFSISLAI